MNSKVYKSGDRLEVRSHKHLKEFGIMFGLRKSSGRAYPGMIGTVQACQWTDWAGHKVEGLELVFAGIDPYPMYGDGTLSAGRDEDFKLI